MRASLALVLGWSHTVSAFASVAAPASPPPSPMPVRLPPIERETHRSQDGLLSVTLTLSVVEYRSSTLVQQVMGYNNAMGGPTLRVRPGDMLRITLVNALPEEACATDVPELHNSYQSPYSTNLHVHGLHVSPNEDEVIFTSIKPGENKTCVYNIPADHAPGTHFYHPHKAGGSSIQAGAGALGLLIVEDPPGILPADVAGLPEMNMHIQFLNFTYLQTDYSRIYVNNCRQFCIPAEARSQCTEYLFENGPTSGMYNTAISADGLEEETLLVNFVERPTFEMTANQWYRFRMVYVPTRYRTIEPAIDGSCEYKLLAKDGMYLPVAPRDFSSGYMTTGSRADWLVRCPAGEHQFVSRADALTSVDAGWIAQKIISLRRTMATLSVKPAAHDPPPAASIEPFSAPRPCYLADMRNLAPAHTSHIIQSGLNPGPPVLARPFPFLRPAFPENISYYAINEQAFELEYVGPQTVDIAHYEFTLQVGSIWEVDYYVPQIHPLHSHTNRMQITQLPNMSTHTDYFQVGDFHDVLHIPIGKGFGKAVFKMQIDRFTGNQLMHCHIYRHTDRGMALVAKIVGDEGTVNEDVGDCYRIDS